MQRCRLSFMKEIEKKKIMEEINKVRRTSCLYIVGEMIFLKDYGCVCFSF